jgi:hypothetical protein
MTETGGTTPPPGAAPGPAVLRYAAFTDHGGGGNTHALPRPGSWRRR